LTVTKIWQVVNRWLPSTPNAVARARGVGSTVAMSARCQNSGKHKHSNKQLNAHKVGRGVIAAKRKDAANATGDGATATTALPPPLATAAPVIDLQLGAQIVGNEPHTAVTLIHMMLNSNHKQLPMLKRAISKRDWTMVRRLVHKLRGGVSYCGTPRLQEVSRCFEDYLTEKHPISLKKVQQFYDSLLQELALVKAQVGKIDLQP